MLLMPGKKKVATVIVASMSPKKPEFVQKMGEESETGEYELPEGGEDDSMMGLVAAAESVIKAVKDGNAKDAAKALKNFIYMCDENEDMSEMEGENGDNNGG